MAPENVNGVATLTLHSPAKVNLYLAITGRRPDGFHNLISVVSPVAFGDTLTLSEAPALRLTCNHADVPVDESNLVLRAARAFAEKTGLPISVHFHLEKRVPMGAGLGGGSSNAVAALRGLNAWHGEPLGNGDMETIAAGLGSDCVLFLRNEPQVMRGRGEVVANLPEGAVERIRGRRLLLFKPSVSINTAWAYRQMATRAPAAYLPEEVAEERLQQWLDGSGPLEELLFNNMEAVAFEKYLALPTLLERIRSRFGVAAGMSGSGSACYAVLPPELETGQISEEIHRAWGDGCFVAETKLP